MSNELDKEIEKVIREGALSWHISYSDMCFIAEHFYELGCRRTAEKYDEIEYNRQRAEEQGSDGLEEEISKKYANDTTTMRTREQYAELARHFAKWGAEQAREQMMKEAVEGEIAKDNRGNNVLRVGLLNNGFEIGDKVRIIIINQDKK